MAYYSFEKIQALYAVITRNRSLTPGTFYAFMSGVIFTGFVVSFPEIDLWVQSAVVQSDGTFLEKRSGFWGGLYVLAPFVMGGIFCGSLVLLLFGEIRKTYILGVDRSVALYLIAVMVTGPGLIVNVLFKNNWGRARPSQVTEFGGDFTFTPAFIRAHECLTNCSFVSGHTSVGFYVMALALLVRPPYRLVAIMGSLIFGMLIGTARIIQGGHFLSDVIFSGLFTVFIVLLCHRYFISYRLLERIPHFRPQWDKG